MLNMEDIVKEMDIDSIDELYSQILYNSDFDGYVYRGHGRECYLLRPSLLRDDFLSKYKTQKELCQEELKRLIFFFRVANDHGLYVPQISDFYNEYFTNSFSFSDGVKGDTYYWLGDELVELGMLAQHYGVKTRLLDWTQDINVAIYFACTDKGTKEDDKCVIWCIDAKWIQEYKKTNKYIPSMVATMVSNNNPDNHEERRRLIEITHDDSIPLRFFMASYKNNENMNAQKGLMSMWQYNMVENENKDIPSELIEIREKMSENVEAFFEREIVDDKKNLNELLLEYFNASATREKVISKRNKPLIYKIRFESRLRKSFLSILDRAGYDCATIYPGYFSIASKVNYMVE